MKNLDYQCYLDAVSEQRHHQEEWLVRGYAPRGFYLKDHCLIKAQGIYHLFHIAGAPNVSCCLPGNELWFGHATTRDFVRWETHEPCLYISPESWDNGHVFAPYVISHDRRYWMFYTGCTHENTQRIGLAVSDDLFHWQKLSSHPIIRPELYDWAYCPTSKGAACRDPHVMRAGEEFLLYYTAVTTEGHGCVALASSTDLLNWNDRGPCYRNPDARHCESSNVQRAGNKYFLFFGGHFESWSYVESDDPYNWPAQEQKSLGRGITAMEVIKRAEERWLVSFFRLGRGHDPSGFRLFLGEIDWGEAAPRIRQVTTEEELRRFVP